jgi:hypothetical protein
MKSVYTVAWEAERWGTVMCVCSVRDQQSVIQGTDDLSQQEPNCGWTTDQRMQLSLVLSCSHLWSDANQLFHTITEIVNCDILAKCYRTMTITHKLFKAHKFTGYNLLRLMTHPLVSFHSHSTRCFRILQFTSGSISLSCRSCIWGSLFQCFHIIENDLCTTATCWNHISLL